ncbi:MAG TPA: hypothetical protein ENN67_08810 [Firmicutes bacterium]|nr:hypothetical protein [Bacillota bacterium]
MKNTKNKSMTRWGVLGSVVLALLLTAGTIYAQGRPGPGAGQGPGMGIGMENGMGPGNGMGAGGPMGMFMMDEEIRSLMGKIRLISAVNKLGLSETQVRSLIECARDAQAIHNREFDPLRNRVRSVLNAELDRVLKGGEFDSAVLQELRTEFAETHEPGTIRAQMDEILDRALGILTDEQKEKLDTLNAPMREEIRERFRDRMREDEEFGRRFRMMDDERRGQIEDRVRERIGDMRERAGRAKMMMVLMSPESVEALELWLRNN